MSLNQFYKVIGISKQGVHDMLNRQNRNKEVELQLMLIVQQIRKDHPSMGAREMYFKISPSESDEINLKDYVWKMGAE